MSLFGGSNADYWEPIRRRLIPHIHSVLRRYGMYAENPAHDREYAYTVMVGEEEMERVLDEEWGFSRNPVAALKHEESASGEPVYEIGSWRKCYKETSGGYADGSPFSKWQFHIRLYPHTCDDGCEHAEIDGRAVDLYVHWEINWLYDPFAHYAGKGWEAEEAKKRTRELVSEEFASEKYFDKFSD